MPTAKVVEALSAYHEFDFRKLEVALANKASYNVEKHRNDLFDAEQLVYLSDPSLHFLTADRGYLRKVVNPVQGQNSRGPEHHSGGRRKSRSSTQADHLPGGLKAQVGHNGPKAALF